MSVDRNLHYSSNIANYISCFVARYVDFCIFKFYTNTA